MNKYDPKNIEKKWQVVWEKNNLSSAEDFAKKPKFYSLIEFPYPSGSGLHVGHCMGYTASDAHTRMKRMQGYNVLFPIGWDAFGLPTENYAIKTGKKPALVTKENTDFFRKQMKTLAYSFDWDREINTSDPEYYKWTQWIFLQFYKHGYVDPSTGSGQAGKLVEIADDDRTTPRLAYQAEMPINWCPSCKIGLANEEVIAGRCERCESPTAKKMQKQWMLRITAYADRLINDLDKTDYLEKIKTQQINWIGKSKGTNIDFELKQNANFIILHGFTGSPKDNFFPWLRAELERRGYKVQAPELPETNNPKIDEQVDFVVDKIKIDENSVILGHSLGAVVAMKVVERLKHPIAKLILAAGFIEPTFKDHKRPFEKTFDWKFDFEKIKKNTGSTIYLRASNDYAVPFEQGDKISNLLNAKIVDFVANEEHICGTHEPVVFDACVDKVRVFTTRADTLFGCAYIVIAPESDYTSNLKSQISNLEEVEKYIENAGKKSDLERTELQKEKTGIRLEGVKAINPINNEEVDVWVADYVLSTYGTGAVMAVPAHDERDFEFAKKYNLLIKEVVIPFEGEEHKGAEFRKTVSAVVHRRSDDKYLIVKWKKFDWFAPSIGGMEKDETPMQAVEREVFEETGYKVKAVEELGGQIESHFYAENKQVWRARIDQPVLCELRDKTPREVSKEELELHEAVWMTANEALQKITHPYNKIGFERYTKKNYAYIGYGKLVNSGEFSGIYSKEAIEAITKKIKKDGNGDFAVNYKLRDWVFSRQHYWGEPIPIIYCEKCGIIPLNESDLPLELPDVKKYEPSNTGESPLAAVSEWVDIKCPRCSGPARRETDTMPNWAGSSWYYLAYIMLGKEKEKIKKQKNGTVNVFDEFKKELEYWLPVDLYNGGMEHTTLHLLYSRFWHKFLYDLKEVPTSEPYQKRIAHGIILGPDGQKMSKSRGNVIIPDDIVSTYGADTMRAYIMFIGPYDQESAWSVAGLQGVFRFLNRVWKNVGKVKEGIDDPKDLLVDLNKYIVSVTDDLENFRLNTYVAKLMEINNEIDSLETVSKDSFGIFLKLLSPAAPHLAEELWEKIGGSESILDQTWPKADAKYLILDYVKIAVQVNGKLRGVVEVGSKATQEEVLDIVRKNSVIANWIKGREIVKVIYRPEKVMSLVIK